MADKRGVLLLVWVHGFRGGDDTFASFPSRIVDTLASLRPNLAVKALVYPAYDTRGFLVDAVAHFVDWLVEQAVLAQTEHGVSPTLVLCAHSMGGMVIADAVAQLQRSPTPWPTILGVIAYDTPFRGLNPAVFKVRLALSECSELTSSQNKLEHAVGIASQGQAALSALGVGWGLLSAMKGQKATPTPSPPASSSKSKPAESTTVATNGAGPASTSWLGSYGIAAGAGVALAAVAGAAFYQKDVLSGHLSWATSHLSYVAELWKTDELEARLNRLEALDQKLSLDGADGEKRPRIKFHWCVSADQRSACLRRREGDSADLVDPASTRLYRPTRVRARARSSCCPRRAPSRRTSIRWQKTRCRRTSTCSRTRATGSMRLARTRCSCSCAGWTRAPARVEISLTRSWLLLTMKNPFSPFFLFLFTPPLAR